MNLFYHLGLWLYRLIARLISPFYAKAALFSRGHNRLIAKMKREISHEAPIIWFHCASLGEFEQGRPIIEGYRLKKPGHKIFITFFSPSGYEVKKNDPIADWIFYFPLDTRRNARRFLNTVKPTQAIFIKYEFWYNYLVLLKKRNIPTYVVSSSFRPSQPFFKWYGAFFRRMLRTFSLIFVQNQASKELLERIRLKNVIVAGDTRFDRVWDQAQKPCNLPVVESFCRTAPGDRSQNREVCVAGSSWPNDEIRLFEALCEHPSIKMILVPHEISDAHITQIMRQFAPFQPLRYTQIPPHQPPPPEARVLVIDAIGLLSSVYRFGCMAYVGGGFEDGIHNALEAAVYGIPIVFGPNYKRFNEAVDLIRIGAAQSIQTSGELSACFDRWRNEPGAREKAGALCLRYVREHLGATQIILDNITEGLANAL